MTIKKQTNNSMRKLIVLYACCIVLVPARAQNNNQPPTVPTIYSQSFNDIDGNPVSMSNYQGKNIVILIAPLKQYDSAWVKEIRDFKIKYADTIKVIGIISIEDGYVDSLKTKVKYLYQSLGVNILLTAPMHTRKQLGVSTSSLINWLTVKTENKYFESDVEGIFQKFIISKRGRLAEVFVSHLKLSSAAITSALRIK